jgi:glutathione S-transferase
MKLYVLPPSPRARKVIALKIHLDLDCELNIVDLAKGDQLAPAYRAMNPNHKMGETQQSCHQVPFDGRDSWHCPN